LALQKEPLRFSSCLSVVLIVVNADYDSIKFDLDCIQFSISCGLS